MAVSATIVDNILQGLPTIVDSLPSQFGASLGDFIDLSDLPAASDIDGSGMMYNGGIVLAGFTVLTLGQLLVLLGFAAGYFGMTARDATRLAAATKPTEEDSLIKK